MKKFLFAAVAPKGGKPDVFTASAYEGVSIPTRGKMVAVVAADEFEYPESSKVGDFVSDCIYWMNGTGEKPKNVIKVQLVPVERLISLLTKMLED